MTMVTVYNFMVPDIREGNFVEAKGKATQETVDSLYGKIISNTEQNIDDSLLNENGRYHEKSNYTES